MPKISDKNEGVKYLTNVANLFKNFLKEKYGEDGWGERYIGEADIRNILRKQGPRAKDVFTGFIRKFNVTHFKDGEGEAVFIVVDRKKVKVQAKRNELADG
jgi:hypothetical protein